MNVLAGVAEVGVYVLVALAVIVLLIAIGLVVIAPLHRGVVTLRTARRRRRA